MPCDPAPALSADPQRRGKKIVIFADGTGNSFAAQESNVWRLYNALDKTEKPGSLLQLARYIPGVGTSGNRIIRMIDGATGIGVPSNVRKLYRFLCWNWEPGDEIYLFGFSRGAFTVRTLAGMIRFQGLMPLMIRDQPVNDSGMKRNSLRAWDKYRRLTAPLWQDGLKMAPWIAGVRWLRDSLIFAKRRLFGQDTHAEVEDAMPPERRPGAVRIHYMGLFDTVEAYGFPFAGLQSFWSWWLWPITFRNRVCSVIVDRADHVLALDDERLTFHPLQFDQTDAGTPAAPTQVREAWFCGMHSDVGGGYPDDAVAMDPLIWIMDGARQAVPGPDGTKGAGLRFAFGSREAFQERLYPRALIHDSRAGMAASYRYAPRPKPEGKAFGGAPVLHRSVLQKIRTGADGYAPLLLPKAPRVCDGPETHASSGPAPMEADPGADGHVRALVRWRRRANRAQIVLAAFLVALPLVGHLHRPLLHSLWGGVQEIALGWMAAFSLKPGPLWALYAGVWPLTLGLLAVLAGLWWGAADLQGRIKDQALRVWRFTG